MKEGQDWGNLRMTTGTTETTGNVAEQLNTGFDGRVETHQEKEKEEQTQMERETSHYNTQTRPENDLGEIPHYPTPLPQSLRFWADRWNRPGNIEKANAG
jgi:hypothetical protein